MHFFPGLVFTYFILKCNLRIVVNDIADLPPLKHCQECFLSPHSYEFRLFSQCFQQPYLCHPCFCSLEPFLYDIEFNFFKWMASLFWLISNATFSRNCLNSVYLVLIHLPTLYLNVIFHTCGNYRKPRALSFFFRFSQIILQSVRFQ